MLAEYDFPLLRSYVPSFLDTVDLAVSQSIHLFVQRSQIRLDLFLHQFVRYSVVRFFDAFWVMRCVNVGGVFGTHGHFRMRDCTVYLSVS